MARSRGLNTYPQEYWKIIERCSTAGEVFEVKMSSVTKALSLQGQFYAFRGALKKMEDRMLARSAQSDELISIAGQVRMAESTVCWIDKENVKESGEVIVRFMPKDKTPNAILLQQFLASGKPQDVVASEDIEKSAQELLEKLGKKE